MLVEEEFEGEIIPIMEAESGGILLGWFIPWDDDEYEEDEEEE